jgi:hypothetical protein
MAEIYIPCDCELHEIENHEQPEIIEITFNLLEVDRVRERCARLRGPLEQARSGEEVILRISVHVGDGIDRNNIYIILRFLQLRDINPEGTITPVEAAGMANVIWKLRIDPRPFETLWNSMEPKPHWPELPDRLGNVPQRCWRAHGKLVLGNDPNLQNLPSWAIAALVFGQHEEFRRLMIEIIWNSTNIEFSTILGCLKGIQG